MQLKPDTLLQGGKYRIDEVLGKGGFGITYKAYDASMDADVAIKEFFMKEYCNRDASSSAVTVPTEANLEMVGKCRKKFVMEARRLFLLNHKHIVRVHNLFEENGTVYYVMEYLPGGSLNSHVPANGLRESEALDYISQIAQALSYVHGKDVLHLDIKPTNIMFREPGEAVLIDFGISKHYDEDGLPTTTGMVGLTPGYAPLEQYSMGNDSRFTPVTDIYSLAATIFKMLTGQTPPEASRLINPSALVIPSSVSEEIASAIRAGMRPSGDDRPQTVGEFMKILRKSEQTKEIDVSQDESTMLVENVSDNNPLVLKIGNVSYPMVSVEGGTFMMGGTSSEKNSQYVKIDGFQVGKYPVTQDLWTAVMGSDPVQDKYKGDNHPVVCVSWDDCTEFLQKLYDLTGCHFRLPTEAEWEFAAGGGIYRSGCLYSGSNVASAVGWIGANSGDMLHDVGQKRPNELGIHDMTGNVWEWCSDWLAPYEKTEQINPKGPNFGFRKVCRGGSFGDVGQYCTITYRSSGQPGMRYVFTGLRLCL